jgi:hypothetical protein
MEALDCGWDKIVYSPELYPITWSQRLQVLHHVAEGLEIHFLKKKKLIKILSHCRDESNPCGWDYP